MGLIDDLKAKHPGVEIFQVDAPEVPEPLFIRKPNRVDVKRFYTENQRDPFRAMANLVRSCLLHPGREEFEAILEDRPALDMLVFKELNELIGANEELLVKKV